MLSNKNGSSAPNKTKAPLLALMTPRLRTLFDDKVEPLLEVVRYREELAAKEKGRATHSRRVENAEESLQSLQARLEAATAAQQTGGQGQKEGGDGDGDEENGGADTDGEMDPKALAQQQRLKDAIAQAQRMKNKYQRKLEKLQKASTKLRGKVRSVLKRQAVGPVLAALEASVIDGGEDQGAEADSSDSSDSDDDKPIAALAASARAKASASAASASASPAPPKKKAKGKATTHKQSGSLLARFLLEQRDPGSCVLGFVGGSSALTGIGATARGVRKAVKASLPHLAVHYIRSKGMPAITAFPRLRHLALDGAHYRRLGAWPKDLLVLNDNLETLRIHSEDERILQPLVIVPWPELRVLEMADLGQFLDAVLARPAVVFPRLLSLAASRLDGQTSRKLLQLLDRGAFPALAALVPCEVGVEQPIQIAPTTSNDMAQLCAVVDRLAVGDSLCLNDYSLDADTSWESFAARIVSGRLAQLKRLTIIVGRNPSAHDISSLLGALANGALAQLQSLILEPPRYMTARLSDQDAETFLPNALPSLGLLRVEVPVPNALLAGLLGAAGPHLATLDITGWVAAEEATRLLAVENYPWLPSLRTLSLQFAGNWWGVSPGVPEPLTTAMSRLPAVRSLTLASGAYDELLVRLLAAVDSGALPQPPKLNLLPMSNHVDCNISNGARLLLLLWLKEEAKKAVDGQAPAVKWEINGLVRMRTLQHIREVTTNCLKQIKEAWAQVEGN